MSGSRVLISWLVLSITVTFAPHRTMASAISRPMYPPPTTTTDWHRATRAWSRSALASSSVWTPRTWSRSMPGRSGRVGREPVATCSWSKSMGIVR